MSWENIGSTNTGEIPRDEAWILWSLRIAKEYIELVCGDPPSGSKLDVMWHDHDLGSYPSLGIWFDFDELWDYMKSCERALEAFANAVEWHKLKEYFEENALLEGDKEE